jgi:hypothetical protein
LMDQKSEPLNISMCRHHLGGSMSKIATATASVCPARG